MQWVWEHSDAGGTDRLVLLAIADAADDNGRNAWPSVATIASKCNVSERTVQRSIQSLEDAGELKVTKQGGGHGGMRADRRPNRYALPVPDGATDCHPERGDGVTPVTERGDTVVADGVTPLSPNPSLNVPERDDALDSEFEDFWRRYPRRHGKKNGKRKARDQWNRLKRPERLAALAGVDNYAESGWLAMDAHRWLRDKEWEDWQTPAEPDQQETFV